MLVPLLMREVGSHALIARLPSLPFPRRPDNSVDPRKTILELLPSVNIGAAFHPFAVKKSGVPCQFAYHFQLFDLMSHRSSEAGWRVLGETRNANARPPLRRLDLLIASNGHRCGVELLVDGDEFDKHLREQAPTYQVQQELTSVLVLNFACSAEGSAAGADVLQVRVDRDANTLTPWSLGDDACTFVSLTAIRTLAEDSTEAHEFADATSTEMSFPSRSGVATALPLTIATVAGVDFALAEVDTVNSLLAAVAAELGLAVGDLELRRVSAGGTSRLAKRQSAAGALAAAATIPGSKLEVEVGTAPPLEVKLC
jgi:hypothetical protein